MSELLEAVQKAREQAFSAKSEIEQRIADTKQRIHQMCRSGTLPFDEAFPAWLSAFEHYADEGAQSLENNLAGYAQPNDPDPITGNTSSLRNHAGEPFRHGSRGDPGAVLAHINRDAIIEQARAWFEERCAGEHLPARDERHVELERLAAELRSLESERDDLEDELARLLGTQPSERTRKQRIRDDNEREAEAINGPIRDWNERNAPAQRNRKNPVQVTVADE